MSFAGFTLGGDTRLLLIYVLVFVGVLTAFEGLRQLLSRGETGREARNRRMKLVRSGATPEDVLSQLLYAERRRGIRLPDIGHMLRQAGLSLPPLGFYMICLAIAVAGTYVLSRQIPIAQAAAFSGGIGLLAPLAVLNFLKRRRMDKLVTQLPDALDLMARGLKVGHPLSTTVASVATEMRDPIGTEFGLLVDQVSYGTEIVDAFADLADRTGLEDVRYLAVTVGIQHGTGGNLGRVLSVLSRVIRDRATMRRRIIAISAEGRLSAIILSMLPFGIFGSIMATTPAYYMEVKDDPIFMPVAVLIVAFVVAQILILWRLVKFEY